MNSHLHCLPTVGSQTLLSLRHFPDRTAFVAEDRAFTGAAIVDLIGRMQKTFVSRGFRRTQRIAMLSGNRTEVWCAGVAAQLSAMSITWLNALSSLDDQLAQLEDFEADALVVDVKLFGSRGGEIAARATRLRQVFTIGPAEYGIDLIAAAEGAGASTPRDLASPDDVAVLIYTGGTTGRSKGVLRRHRDYAGFTPAILADFEIPAVPRYLAVTPISHVAGTKILPVLMRGGSVHLRTGFDPEKMLATIEREQINVALLVPTMIYLLLDHPRLPSAQLSSLELLLYGASPMSPSRLVEGIQRIGPVFSQMYGQAECYPVSVLRKTDHDVKRPDLFESCGYPVAACDVRILDDEDREVATGETGEICVRGPHVMEQYWNRPEETSAALKNGWLRTGDIARADERGYLFILDRKKDMIISGGLNIYPREVEDVLSSHADVAMVAVIGMPDPKWGEAVTAMIVPRAGSRPNAEELVALVKQRKGSAHAPKHVEFVETLPMTPIGKVDKKALRSRLWADQKRMVS
jgi:fatty-acyl-CoA synthase